jgi:hypothetical protein
MAIIYWKLGHLTAEGFQRPLESFLVFRDGVVFDVDSHGWDLGIRPGQELAEMKWRHPSAVWIPWQPSYYQKLWSAVQEWLRVHAAAFQQTDPRQGWWEWPRLTLEDWQRLMDTIVPRWAQRVEAGAASHPWLAHWIAEEGAQLNLPKWRFSYGQTYVLHPGKEEQYWPRLPLRFVEGIPVVTRQQWHKRRFERVQDVPGLLSRMRPYGLSSAPDPSEVFITRRFDEPVSAGVGEILRDMASELVSVLQAKNGGVRFLRVTWFRDRGIERREREWPTVAGDAKSVQARVLSLLSQPPLQPFDEVQLQIHIEPLAPAQMAWWDRPQVRSALNSPGTGFRLSVGRREQLLQYWDLWRIPGGGRA